MKTSIFLLASGLLFASCNSNSGAGSNSMYDTNKALYERSIKYSDYGTALVALNYMLMEDSTNMEYTDSIARLYMRSGSFDAGLELGAKVMEAEPKNYTLLEIMATAQEYKGDEASLTKAYRNYKKLYEEVGGTKYLLKQAQVGIIKGSFDVAESKLKTVLESDEIGMIESQRADGGSQLVEFKAVAHLLMANIRFNQTNDKEGVKHLEESLRISPDYEAAKLMVQRLQQIQQQQQAMGQQQAYQQQVQAEQARAKKLAAEKKKEADFLKNNK